MKISGKLGLIQASIAVALTLIAFLIGNGCFRWSAMRSLSQMRLPMNSTEDSEETQELDRALGLDKNGTSVEELNKLMSQGRIAPGDNCHKVLHGLASSICSRPMVASNGPNDLSRIKSAIDNHLMGTPEGWRWWWPFPYQATSGKFADLVEGLSRIDKTWPRSAEIDDTLNQSFQALFEYTAKHIEPKVRCVMFFNGWIQWLTVLIFCLVLVMLSERYCKLRPLSDSMGTITVHMDMYRTVQWLVGAMPALGFIGTVIGMGEALATANLLFTSKDKSSAIASITGHLGFAFDTTRLALILSLLAGFLVVWLQQYESALIRENGKRISVV